MFCPQNREQHGDDVDHDCLKLDLEDQTKALLVFQMTLLLVFSMQVPRLVRISANELEDIQEAEAGDIVAIFGMECSSGDTFTDGSGRSALGHPCLHKRASRADSNKAFVFVLTGLCCACTSQSMRGALLYVAHTPNLSIECWDVQCHLVHC